MSPLYTLSIKSFDNVHRNKYRAVCFLQWSVKCIVVVPLTYFLNLIFWNLHHYMTHLPPSKSAIAARIKNGASFPANWYMMPPNGGPTGNTQTYRLNSNYRFIVCLIRCLKLKMSYGVTDKSERYNSIACITWALEYRQFQLGNPKRQSIKAINKHNRVIWSYWDFPIPQIVYVYPDMVL